MSLSNEHGAEQSLSEFVGQRLEGRAWDREFAARPFAHIAAKVLEAVPDGWGKFDGEWVALASRVEWEKGQWRQAEGVIPGDGELPEDTIRRLRGG